MAHVGGLAPAFTAAAGKKFGELTDTPPVEGSPLDADWHGHVDTGQLDRIVALSGRDPGWSAT